MLLLFSKYSVCGKGDKSLYLVFTVFSHVRAELTVFVSKNETTDS